MSDSFTCMIQKKGREKGYTQENREKADRIYQPAFSRKIKLEPGTTHYYEREKWVNQAYV